MKCSAILKNALRLLKAKGIEDGLGDFAERAPYILSAMFSEAARIDKRYRAANNLENQPRFSPTHSELDEEFPLCDCFSKSAAFYLAALLIIDDDSELSDAFYEKYCDSMSSIASSIN